MFDDRRHACFGLGELGLAMAAQGGASLIGGNGVLQLLLASFESPHDLLQVRQRILERHLTDIHGLCRVMPLVVRHLSLPPHPDHWW